MSPDYDTLVEAARALAAAQGIRVDQVTLTHRGKPVLLLPISPQSHQSERGGLSECVQDILEVLEAAKKPLTRTLILKSLAKAGKEWSERAVAGHLAELVKDQTLINSSEPGSPGYRLS